MHINNSPGQIILTSYFINRILHFSSVNKCISYHWLVNYILTLCMLYAVWNAEMLYDKIFVKNSLFPNFYNDTTSCHMPQIRLFSGKETIFESTENRVGRTLLCIIFRNLFNSCFEFCHARYTASNFQILWIC